MPAAAVVGALGTAYMAKKQSDAMGAAADQQQQMAQQQMTPPPWVKRANKSLWGMLTPDIQKYMAGQRPQVISPDLENAQYENLRAQTEGDFQKQQAGVEQGMVNRGLEYGTLLPKALAEGSDRYNRFLGDERLKIRQNAAVTNYQAEQDLVNKVMGIFSQGNNYMGSQVGQGMAAMYDANSARAAANPYGAYASALGSILGQFGGGGGWG